MSERSLRASQETPHATESDGNAEKRALGVRTPERALAGRKAIDAAMSEAEWQRQVEEVAERCGFVWFHDADSRRNRAGFPDLTLCHAGRGVLLFVELKSERGRLRADQRRWGDALLACGADWRVWRPSDFAEVLATLKGA